MKFTLVDGTGALNAYLFDYVSKLDKGRLYGLYGFEILFVFKIANISTEVFILCSLQCFYRGRYNGYNVISAIYWWRCRECHFYEFFNKIQEYNISKYKDKTETCRSFHVSIGFFAFPWLNFSFVSYVKLCSLNAVWMMGVFQNLFGNWILLD